MKLKDLLYLSGTESKKFSELGIDSRQKFINIVRTPSTRTSFSKKAGISKLRISEIVKSADLQRVRSIKPAMAKLLIDIGIDSLKDLARRNPDNLHSELLQTKTDQNIKIKVPQKVKVDSWIKAAKKFPKIVSSRNTLPSERRRNIQKILSFVSKTGLSNYEDQLITASLMELYSDIYMSGASKKEREIDLSSIPSGCLFEAGKYYSRKKEFELKSMIVTFEPTSSGNTYWQHNLRVSEKQLPKQLKPGQWLLFFQTEKEHSFKRIKFFKFLSMLTESQLEKIVNMFETKLEFESEGDVLHIKWGEDIFRETDAIVNDKTFAKPLQLYILEHFKDENLSQLIVLNNKIRVGPLVIRPTILIEKNKLPAGLREKTSKELVAEGKMKPLAVLQENDQLKATRYKLKSEKVEKTKPFKRSEIVKSANISVQDKERLKKLSANLNPVSLKNLTAVTKGSVHIHWHYWEASGLLDGTTIWHCVMINDNTLECSFESRPKSEEQITLESEVADLTQEKSTKESELTQVETSLTELQEEINSFAALVEGEEEIAEAAESEAEALEPELESLNSERDDKTSELAELEDEQEDDQNELENNESELDWIESRLTQIEEETNNLIEEEEFYQAELEDKEIELADKLAELDVAVADADEMDHRYDVNVIDRATWGAQTPATDPDWYDYPTTNPLSHYLNSIVVHHTADPQSQTIQELEAKERAAGYSDLPYHFVITEDGTIYEGREIGSMGAHAGVGITPGTFNDPDYGRIGIVLTGDYQQDWNTWFPDTPTSGQLSSLKALAGNLCRTYSIDPSDIMKHSEVPDRAGAATVCPGANLAGHVDSIESELVSELPTYDADLDSANQKVEELNDEIEQLEYEIDNDNWTIEEIQDSISDLQSEGEELSAELEFYNDSIAQLQESIEERGTAMDELRGEIQELDSQIEELEQQKSDLQSQAEQHHAAAREYQKEVDDRVETRTDLRAQKEQLEGEIENLQEQIDSKQELIDQLNTQVGQPYNFGDEDSMEIIEIIFDAEYPDPWTLEYEDFEGGMWGVHKLQANPNLDCTICGPHAGEEYEVGSPGYPYHPYCDCDAEYIQEEISAQ